MDPVEKIKIKKRRWARKCTRKESKGPERKVITHNPFKRGVFIEEAVKTLMPQVSYGTEK